MLIEIIMKILFMGTGAADWNIETRKNETFFRRFTSVMINDDLMIDCNNETLDFIEKNNCDVGKVENILITHTHSDHFSSSAIEKILTPDKTVIGDERAIPRFNGISAVSRSIPLYTPVKVGKYEIVAVAANHSVENSDEQPLHYIISDGEKRIFWGCDGAWLLNKSWHTIRNYTYDLTVFDGTLNDAEGDYRIFEHNNLHMIIEINATFKALNLMNSDSKTMISHMSRYSQYSHSELEKYLQSYNIIPAYDGMEINI